MHVTPPEAHIPIPEAYNRFWAACCAEIPARYEAELARQGKMFAADPPLPYRVLEKSLRRRRLTGPRERFLLLFAERLLAFSRRTWLHLRAGNIVDAERKLRLDFWRRQLSDCDVRAILIDGRGERVVVESSTWTGKCARWTHWTGKLEMSGPSGAHSGRVFIPEKQLKLMLTSKPSAEPDARQSRPAIHRGAKKQRVWKALDDLSAAGVPVEGMTPKEVARQIASDIPGDVHLTYVGMILREWKATRGPRA